CCQEGCPTALSSTPVTAHLRSFTSGCRARHPTAATLARPLRHKAYGSLFGIKRSTVPGLLAVRLLDRAPPNREGFFLPGGTRPLAMTQRRRWIRFALPAFGELAKPSAVLEQIWNTLLRSPSQELFYQQRRRQPVCPSRAPDPVSRSPATSGLFASYLSINSENRDAIQRRASIRRSS